MLFRSDKDNHWKWNCPTYLTTLKKKEGGPFGGMLVIEINLTVFSTSSWMFDSGSSAHLCISLQDLEDSRRLRDSEMILSVGNRAKIATMVVKTYPLRLLMKNILILRNCYFISTASRNLIFVSCLTQKDYIINFFKDHCAIYLRNNKVRNDFLINDLF